MTELAIAELTTGDVAGDGVFDVLMRSMKAHLAEEYSKQRLRGPEYSTVYLSGLQSAMDQGIRFLFDRTNVELQRLQVQIAEKDLLLKDKEITLADKNIELAQTQIDKLLAEIPLTEAQVRKIDAEILNIPKQGAVLDAQECKLKGEYNLIIQQIARSVADTTLIEQKTTTEKAQVDASIADVESTIGRQNLVLENQARGYIRLAEQRAAEIMSGLFQMYLNVDEGSRVSDGVSTEDIKNTITKMTEGVDVVVTNTPNVSSDA